MKKLILKFKNYFERRRNYKTLKALVLKNSNESNFEECFLAMASLNTFRKEGCMYYLDADNKPIKVYPEVVIGDKPSVRLKNEPIK